MTESTPLESKHSSGQLITGELLRPVLLAMFAVPAVLTLLALGARWWWALELCTHFTAHYFMALVVGTAFSAWMKFRRIAAVFGAIALYNLALIAPLYWPVTASDSGGQTIRVMTANVLNQNHDHDKFLQVVDETSPDVFVVLELTRGCLTALDALKSDYPHGIARPREDSFGIGLWSRLPADELEIREIGPAEVPSVYARFNIASQPFYVIGSHTLPPVSAEHSALRNAQLRALAELAASLEAPLIMLGDLNITSWSPMFRDLISVSQLRDSRRGHGIQATWPSELCPFGIAIDHVLASPQFTVRHRLVGRDVGSDHRPVVADLVLPARD